MPGGPGRSRTLPGACGSGRSRAGPWRMPGGPGRSRTLPGACGHDVEHRSREQRSRRACHAAFPGLTDQLRGRSLRPSLGVSSLGVASGAARPGTGGWGPWPIPGRWRDRPRCPASPPNEPSDAGERGARRHARPSRRTARSPVPGNVAPGATPGPRGARRARPCRGTWRPAPRQALAAHGARRAARRHARPSRRTARSPVPGNVAPGAARPGARRRGGPPRSSQSLAPAAGPVWTGTGP